MKLYFITGVLLVSVFVSQAQTKKTTKYFTVSGQVKISASYCGGAAPSEEMLEELKRERPYIGKTFYVRVGRVNDLKKAIVLKFKTDSSGKFSLKLSPGTYCIIQAEQVNALNYKKYSSTSSLTIDKACLSEWWKKPYRVLEVKDKAISGLHFSFQKRCFIEGDLPCLTFNGPFPP